MNEHSKSLNGEEAKAILSKSKLNFPRHPPKRTTIESQCLLLFSSGNAPAPTASNPQLHCTLYASVRTFGALLRLKALFGESFPKCLPRNSTCAINNVLWTPPRSIQDDCCVLNTDMCVAAVRWYGGIPATFRDRK